MARRAMALAEQPDGELQFRFEKFVVHVNGLPSPTAPVTFRDCERLGGRLSVLHKGLQFVVGDWLNLVEDRFGEEAAQLVDASQWAERTISVYRWAARQVAWDVRMMHRGLAFAHHLAVAALSPRQQRKWLERAVNEKGGEPWTVARLKAALREGEDAPVVGWYLLVRCDSEAQRAAERAALEGRGLVCKPVDKRRRRKTAAAA